MMMVPFLQGFGMGGGLIVAIGAQNAFVLSRGVRKEFIFLVPAVCAFFDILFIAAGVSGVGSVVAQNPALLQVAAYGGALFLGWYGFRAFRSMVQGGSLATDSQSVPSLKNVLAATVAVTVLNPHVYLDTIVLLGSISGQFAGDGRYLFGLGASVASVLWFFTLSLGGRVLAPLFQKPMSWRVLDCLVGCTMWGIAWSLIA